MDGERFETEVMRRQVSEYFGMDYNRQRRRSTVGLFSRTAARFPLLPEL
jgi:hypothetical protein